ncbi:malto-oligosyltrehalose synthase [Acetobacter indonesiensis]|uniref:malto-oligosyltrehalose synthase n=1 Tax=Acetobacter indonesiensis TaxID=104101 RepID=UPI001F0008C3|nr:malto-oligosyltrehalose synthase [Acetobacter indonesiensis]MCG0995820.1 malto-oligosyltrehalose synthase [Acetobacter indonesiensis]
MNTVRATMRLQIHKEFTLYDAYEHVDYYDALGISHLYLSPLFTARPGSMHGYDTLNYNEISEERGGEKALRKLVAKLRSRHMGIILDIVPNHMAVGPGNIWWDDVLKNGRTSQYADFFDIDWSTGNHTPENTVLLPFLDRPYGDALENGLIELIYNPEKKEFFISHYDHCFPVNQKLSTAPDVTETLNYYDNKTDSGKKRLHTLLEKQHYRLACWRCADETVNWRRFFNITELVALKVENQPVFQAVHDYAFLLYEQGLVDGFRVDHVDGLTQPGQYCNWLKREMDQHNNRRPIDALKGDILYIEKILARHENLPANWKTDGTTGYDFLDQVNLLLHYPDGEERLDNIWKDCCPLWKGYEKESISAKNEIVETLLLGSTNKIVALLYEYAGKDLYQRDYTKKDVRETLKSLLGHLHIYRTYASDDAENIRVKTEYKSQNTFLEQAIETATKYLPSRLPPLLSWIVTQISNPINAETKQIRQTFEHLSAPLTAKAIEDTLFYRYGRLLSRNDVGTEPKVFSSSVEEFHNTMKRREQETPMAMLATATHDHKRGEDSRARLAVISAESELWDRKINEWRQYNTKYKTNHAPDDVDELILYQTLVGVWPLEKITTMNTLEKRVSEWQIKAIREAKRHGTWADPDANYEKSCLNFLHGILEEKNFLSSFSSFFDKIAPIAAINSLTQIILKLTAPGVPDIYQGTEKWDFSLVDPDNRRPVDYEDRKSTLLIDENFEQTAQHWQDGNIKQFLIKTLLNIRKEHTNLFKKSSYVPIQNINQNEIKLISYLRKNEKQEILILAPVNSSVKTPDHMTLSCRNYLKNTIHFENLDKNKWISELWKNVSIDETGTLHIPDDTEYFPIDIFIPV